MSRLSRIVLLSLGLVFMLACALITNPINDVKDTANTAQAFVTDAAGLATQAAPLATLIANPSLIPDVGNYFDPQGTPVAEWNGIPIMPQATAGQEHDPNNYSFRFTGTVKEASDFYTNGLEPAGWSTMIAMPGDENGAILVYQKDSSILTLTVTNMNDGTIVVLLTIT